MLVVCQPDHELKQCLVINFHYTFQVWSGQGFIRLKDHCMIRLLTTTRIQHELVSQNKWLLGKHYFLHLGPTMQLLLLGISIVHGYEKPQDDLKWRPSSADLRKKYFRFPAQLCQYVVPDLSDRHWPVSRVVPSDSESWITSWNYQCSCWEAESQPNHTFIKAGEYQNFSLSSSSI